MNINNLGNLYIVATPIGNLQDMSLRAIETLKNVDLIAAEDTRHSAALLQHFSISTPLLALHEHNERERANTLLERLQQGESIALISDAGTPLISDPGYFLVKEARGLGVNVIPIPGPCAAIVALSAAGLPTDRFIFEGFLPAKTKGRVDRLTALKHEPRTMIFYEAPHRIVELLEDMQTVFGNDRTVVIARELTKKFETMRSGALFELVEWVKNDPNQQKGELVVLAEGSSESPANIPSQELLTLLLEHLPLKQAVEIAAKISGDRKNDLYDLAVLIKKNF
ncbi:MAG: 16S rRNA (cytidine(1402)-2'-O)-methyltransferase, partial [Gammaproteobacteria bacterium]